MDFIKSFSFSLRLASLTMLIFSLNFLVCVGFSPKSTTPAFHTATNGFYSLTPRSMASSSSPIENDCFVRKSSSNGDMTRAKISYRSATSTDIPAIAQLLNSIFDDSASSVDVDNDVVGTDSAKNDENKNTFMWDSLDTSSEEEQLSPEEQREFIRKQLAKRMADSKKEGSLPHSFLVATAPSSEVAVSTSEPQEDLLIGFLEIGTLPSPFGGNVEMPYIGNVAVANEARRRKVGSTLVHLAKKIASKWCTPSSKESPFPPFLFLSVERDNRDALLFYERLGFEELSVGKTANSVVKEKVYLAREID